MGNLATSSATLAGSATASGGTNDMIVVWSPARLNADCKPRVFGSASQAMAFHGYGEGIEFVDFHVQNTRKPVLFCGLPIATVGAIGRVDKSGNTGASVASVVAGSDGVLHEHFGRARVLKGGVAGTDQIILEVSLDDGRVYRQLRLGTALSAAIPDVGATISVTADTLVAGDEIISWYGSSPHADSAGMAIARAKMTESDKCKGARTCVLIGDCQDVDQATAFLTQINAYRLSDGRAIEGRVGARDIASFAEMSHDMARMVPGTSLTFTEVGGTGDTITRATGSWLTDGFAVGDTFTVAGSASNNVTGVIASLSALVMTLASTDLVDEVSAVASVVGHPTLAFANSGSSDTITRNRGSWIADGFLPGGVIAVDGTASNDTATGPIVTATALVLTFGAGTTLAAEVVSTDGVDVTVGELFPAYVASLDEEYEDVDGEWQIDVSLGRARALSNLSQYRYRRPAWWHISAREYQHDLHRASWDTSEQKLPNCDIYDSAGELAEYDDRVFGGAASVARFSSLRTYANGQRGTFVSQSLTRASSNDLLAATHRAQVTCKALNIIHAAQESIIIGRDLELNADGTATSESIAQITEQMNTILSANLRVNALNEGPNCSDVSWVADPLTLYNVAEPTMIGTCYLTLNGTIHSVATTVRLNTGL